DLASNGASRALGFDGDPLELRKPLSRRSRSVDLSTESFEEVLDRITRDALLGNHAATSSTPISFSRLDIAHSPLTRGPLGMRHGPPPGSPSDGSFSPKSPSASPLARRHARRLRAVSSLRKLSRRVVAARLSSSRRSRARS